MIFTIQQLNYKSAHTVQFAEEIFLFLLSQTEIERQVHLQCTEMNYVLPHELPI